MQRYLFYWFNEKKRAKSVRFYVIFSMKEIKTDFKVKKLLEKFGV